MPHRTNKTRGHAEPLKFEPVAVMPLACTLAELHIHLRAFISRFIADGAQGRWLEFMVERRSDWYPPEVRARNMKIYRKVDSLLNMFESQDQYIHEIKGADKFPQSLALVYGTARGVYFNPSTEPCQMTAAEAATKATEDFSDAILSFIPGKKALFFHHEGGVWLCERG